MIWSASTSNFLKAVFCKFHLSILEYFVPYKKYKNVLLSVKKENVIKAYLEPDRISTMELFYENS